MTAAELAVSLNVTERTIFNDLAKIRDPEQKSTGSWGGARNCLMAFEEEEFLNEYLERAQDGLLVTMPLVHVEFNSRVGKDVPKSTFYRMLERHGWRKVKPDTRHPHSNPEVQDEFKKKRSKFLWIRLPKK